MTNRRVGKEQSSGQQDITKHDPVERALGAREPKVASDLEAMTRLQKIGTLFVSGGNLESVLGEIVEAAIAISGADYGNIQLLNPKTSKLEIAAYHGFPDWWVSYWNVVSEGRGTCGTALKRGERVIVEDVAKSPIFAGNPEDLAIQLRAGVRAIQSTPLMSRSGKLIGMFSTQYKTPHRPDERTLRLLDLLARQATDIIERARAEEALRESEEMFRSLFESSPSAVFLTHPDGSILAANPAACTMFGWAEQDLCRRGRSGIFDESDPRLGEALAERRRSGRLQDVELTAIRKNGERFPVEVDSVILRSDPARSFVIVRDITDRKRSEVALRESERRFRLALKNAPVSVAVQDSSLRYIWAYNQKTVPPEGILGKQDSEIFTPEEAAHITEMKRRVLEENVELREQMWLNRPSGRIFVDVCWEPIRDETGKAIGVGSATVDLTPMKLAEEAVLQSEARFRMLHESLRDAYVQVAMDGRIIEFNDIYCQMLGYSPEEVHAVTYQELTPERWHEFEQRIVREQIIPRGYSDLYEKEYRRKDGTVIPVELRTILSRDPSGEPNAMWAIVRDITERKRAEKALRVAKDDLEHRVAERTTELRQTVEALQQEIARRESAEHVLRERSEQLRALASELTLAEQRERRRLAEVLHDDLQQLLVGAKFRLTMLSRAGDARVKQLADEVEDLLHRSIECSRTLTGELSPPILHHGGLLPALEWLVVWMQEKHALAVDLQTDGSAEPGSEEMRVLLFQSARELLFNAAKHARVTRARVCLERNDEHVVLTVADDGVGFDPDEAIPRAGRPGGFGLFSIRERLDLLGGRLEIDAAPGRGSRFRMVVRDVDVAADRERRADRVAGVRVSSVAGGRDGGSNPKAIQVMLVDDHVVFRQGLAMVLRGEPDMKVVAEASDGETAVDLVRRLRPDVVLMDVGMRGMDGIEATRIICSECPAVRVIGLSMFQEEEPAARMRQAGAVDFLTKSGPTEEVVAAIRACLVRPELQT